MLLTAAVAGVSAAGLALVLGTMITFGHRSADSASKFDEKSKADELQDLQAWIRIEEASPHLERLWAFFDDAATQDSKLRHDASALFTDVTRRSRMNVLVNGLEQAHGKSLAVITAFKSVKMWNRRISRILYAFAGVEGVTGFSLIFLGAQNSAQISWDQFDLGVFGMVVLALATLLVLVLCKAKANGDQKTYDDAKSKYLLEGVHNTN